jgi:YedE family putative selenium metabolism protein
MPVIMTGLLLLLVFRPQFSDGGPIFSSSRGPGSLHAPILASLIAGLVIGFLAQRTRFCTMGAVRDVILIRDTHLLSGVGALLITACATNLVFGQFDPGLTGQPVAHSNHVWNFLGMALSGLAFALAGGCPGRQLFLAGEGDGDASVFVLGMFTGAAFAHNFALAARPDRIAEGVVPAGGLTTAGQVAVLMGIAACLTIGFTMREQ